MSMPEGDAPSLLPLAASQVDGPRPAKPQAAKWVLLLITLAGAALRFAWLGRPCLWGDEALVYWRTCGTYGQLLQPLHGDGFPPLHYELYWLIVHLLGHAPGPAAMRVVPAVCGTLLVPAVYFLARQLLPRRPALTAAAFTAGSAFALFYSRDAKMYAEAWLAMTVAVACLMAWLRTGRATAWLGWVAAGAAAGGLQTLSLVPTVALGPLLLLTGRRAHWRRTLAWLGGAALVVAGPVGYYARFNVWTEDVDQNGWRESGLAWVAAYNDGRSGPDQVRFLATTFLTGWEWPRPAAFNFMSVGRRRALEGGVALTATALLLGTLPWPTRWRSLGSPDDAPEPPWRTGLWLTAWIVLPIYGFYCRSVPDFATPADWLAWAGVGAHPRWWMTFSATALATGVAAVVWRPTRSDAGRWLSAVLAVAAVVAGCQLIAAVMAPLARAVEAAGHPWQSVWVPRYLGFAWPPVAIGAGVLLSRLPARAGPVAGTVIVLGFNLGMFAVRAFGSTEPPVDRMAADVWAAQPVGGRPSDTLTWTSLRPARGGNGFGHLYSDPGRYYLQLLARRPMSPALFKQSLGTFVLHSGRPAGIRPTTRAIGPTIHRIVLWEQFDPAPPPTDASPDALVADLPGCRRVADESFPVRDVWTGQDLTCYRRREYQLYTDAAPVKP